MTDLKNVKSIFLSVAKSRSKLCQSEPNSEAGLAWKCLSDNVTFRLPANADKTRTIGFRIIWRVMRKIRSGSTGVYPIEGGDTKYAFLDGVYRGVDQRIHYVEREAGIRPGWFLTKEDHPGILKGRLPTLTFLKVALPIAFRCFFSKHQRTNRALQIAQIVELSALLYIVAEHEIEVIYDNAPYFIDSNWQYLLLRPLIREYFKLPSPGPLKTHNAITLCDTLVVSSGYHQEELSALPHVRYKRTLLWVVEHAHNYIDRYLAGNLNEPKPMTLGFYSHASWLRKAQGHRDNGLNIEHAEEELLNYLKSFLNTNPTYQLTVFLHPREKETDMLEDSKQYYLARLGTDRICFAERNVGTSHSFETIDLALAAFSTIMYERLFAGYKTLIGNMGIKDFPITSSALNAICFSNEAEMIEKIKKTTVLTREAFFEEYKLWNYHHTSYPTLTKKYLA